MNNRVTGTVNTPAANAHVTTVATDVHYRRLMVQMPRKCSGVWVVCNKSTFSRAVNVRCSVVNKKLLKGRCRRMFRGNVGTGTPHVSAWQVMNVPHADCAREYIVMPCSTNASTALLSRRVNFLGIGCSTRP